MNEPSTPHSGREAGDGIVFTPSTPDVCRNVNQREFPGSVARDQRRLLIRSEVLSLLQLSDEKVQQLINTRQIAVFRIAGEERFDSRDLDQLIESYKSTAARRP